MKATLPWPRRVIRTDPREMRRAMWSQVEHVPIGHPAWREQVKHKLLDGLGVEDIAVWLDCHVGHVRLEVKRLRRNGDLQRWWGRA